MPQLQIWSHRALGWLVIPSSKSLFRGWHRFRRTTTVMGTVVWGCSCAVAMAADSDPNRIPDLLDLADTQGQVSDSDLSAVLGRCSALQSKPEQCLEWYLRGASVAISREDYAASERLAREALHLVEISPRLKDRRSAALGSLGFALEHQNRPLEALRPAQEALSLLQNGPAPNGAMAAIQKETVAYIYRDLGRFQAAAALLAEARSNYEALSVSPDWTKFRVQMRFSAVRATVNLAHILTTLDRADEAEPLMRRVLPEVSAEHGSDDLLTAIANGTIGEVLLGLGQDDQAIPYFKEAVRIGIATNDKKNLFTYLANLVTALQDSKSLTQTVETYTQIGEMLQSGVNTDSETLSTLYVNYGSFLTDNGEPAQALPYLEAGIGIRVSTVGPDHPSTADALAKSADALYRSGRLDDAEKRYIQAVDVQDRSVGPLALESIRTRASLAHFYLLIRHNAVRALAEYRLSLGEISLRSAQNARAKARVDFTSAQVRDQYETYVRACWDVAHSKH